MKSGTIEVNILWTIIIMLSTVLGFFLIRYVTRKDKRDDNVIKKLQEHDKKALKQAEQIENIAQKMSEYILQMKEAGVRFEYQVNQEISAIRKETSEIKSLIIETKASFEIVSERMSLVKNEMVTLFKTVISHANSLSMGAKTIHRHDQEISKIYEKPKFSRDSILLETKEDPEN